MAAPTDIGLLESPGEEILHPSRPIPLRADSSQSSMNSMFSRLSVNSNSQRSIDLPPSKPVYSMPPLTPVAKPRYAQESPSKPRYNSAVPTSINKLFIADPSPNVSHRETPIEAHVNKPVVSTPELIQSKATPRTVSNFADSLFGTDLNQVTIAHDNEVQKLFDDHQIEWGTQYELARGVSTEAWTWGDVRERVKEFIGSNEEIAPKVRSLMKKLSLPASKNISIW